MDFKYSVYLSFKRLMTMSSAREANIIVPAGLHILCSALGQTSLKFTIVSYYYVSLIKLSFL